jgi:hypothetical protein
MASSLAALVLSSCGGASVSLRQLRAQATAICREAGRQVSSIALPASPVGGAAFVNRGAALLEVELRRLRALQPPSDQSGDYEAATGELARVITALRRGGRELESGDPVIAIRKVQNRLLPLEARMARAWNDLGISACASV